MTVDPSDTRAVPDRSSSIATRVARPDDFDVIASVVDDWWGRSVSAGLPRLFLDHFWATSRVAEDHMGLAGFVVAFLSPSDECAYIHFAGVRPDHRRTGLAARLYAQVELHARKHGCQGVRAITAPGNTGSIAFHQQLGFRVAGPIADYDGPGRSMITFYKAIL